MNLRIKALYTEMLQQMGPQGWWPAESKIEIALGAILVQNTNWRNVDHSLLNLKTATAFNPKKILALSDVQLQALISPSGFFRNKSRGIQELFSWLNDYDFNYPLIVKKWGQLRAQLLTLHNIGDETADVLLVYVFDQPVFIADKYAQKLFKNLGLANCDTYLKLKKQIRLPKDFTFEEAQEFHGLIDEFGKCFLKNPTTWQQSFLKDFQLFERS